MAQALARHGWDVLAWNLRGCSGPPNRRLRTYHSGATEDLAVVVEHALAQGYPTAALVGFSLGGNLTLKYLGERGRDVDPRIRGAAAFSVPVDLRASARRLDRPSNWHYVQYFLRTLRAKVKRKAARWPDRIDAPGLTEVRTLVAFDDRYTAPLNGFRDAVDYYRQASSKPFLNRIAIPTLLVNAANDPFLAAPCYPRSIARDHPLLTLEIPEEGGHVGFAAFHRDGLYWSERRAAAFLEPAKQDVPARPTTASPDSAPPSH
jgi:predicted alpha/beta-fold hydrolase